MVSVKFDSPLALHMNSWSAGVPPASRERKPELADEMPALPGIVPRFIRVICVHPCLNSFLPRRSENI